MEREIEREREASELDYFLSEGRLLCGGTYDESRYSAEYIPVVLVSTSMAVWYIAKMKNINANAA